ncbi:MAG: alcohol dehydrogenase catalytic domain-containing protein [Actinomycetota bacterium]|nr:alcohol dehydrogenase catalytic domain-containing protein [Actinomycetota bacterium]
MKALFCYSQDEFKLEEIDRPGILEDEMLIEMLYTGLCGSDIVKIMDPEVKKPAVFGHEVAGRVIETGKNVKEFKKGDIVVTAHHIPCYKCHYCLHGSHSMCRHFKETNIYPGSFCQYIRLSGEHIKYTTFKVPQELNPVAALFIEPLACCIRAMDRIAFRKNDIFSVVGTGVIGMLFIQLIKSSGGIVAAIDLNDERLSLARTLGADYIINPSNEIVTGEIKKITAEGIDVAILTVTNKNTLGDALSYLRDGGTVSIFGASGKESRFEVDLENVYKRELTIMSSYSATPESLKRAFDIITGEKLKISPLLSEVLPLSDFKKGLDLMMRKKIYKAVFKL